MRRHAIGVLTVIIAALAAAAPVMAEPAGSGVRSFQSGHLDAGMFSSCAVLTDGGGRCWGHGSMGRLGYGTTDNIGDDEVPASAGPVDLGAGRTATAITAGNAHTCAALDDGTMRCWGFNLFHALGYPGVDWIGDDETPDAAGPVVLGLGTVPRVADVSLAATRSADTVAVGGDITAVLTVSNAGPDPAVGTIVAVDPIGDPTIVAQVAAIGSFDAANGAWWPETLAPGATATLCWFCAPPGPARSACGPRSPPPRPPTPTAHPATAPPPRTTSPSPRRPSRSHRHRRHRRLRPRHRRRDLPRRPRRSRRPPRPKAAPTPHTVTGPGPRPHSPNVFLATGRLVLTNLTSPVRTACRGTVTLTARAGTRKLITRRATLELVDGVCQYRARLTISKTARRTAKTATIRASFTGNPTLLATNARAIRARMT